MNNGFVISKSLIFILQSYRWLNFDSEIQAVLEDTLNLYFLFRIVPEYEHHSLFKSNTFCLFLEKVVFHGLFSIICVQKSYLCISKFKNHL